MDYTSPYGSKDLPQKGDYVQLLDSHNNPCENFTLVDSWDFELGYNLFIIEDQSGQDFAVARCEDFDTDLQNGWQQVIWAVAQAEAQKEI